MIKTGFSAAVYTQTTDVEGEINGLMTSDRKVIKLDEERLKKMNHHCQKKCDDKNSILFKLGFISN